MVETVVTTIEDEFHLKVKKYIKKREILVLIVCVFTFFLSLPNICPVNLTKLFLNDIEMFFKGRNILLYNC